jgi:GTPase
LSVGFFFLKFFSSRELLSSRTMWDSNALSLPFKFASMYCLETKPTNQPTNCRHERASESAEFLIDEVFGVPGVGTVVAGTCKRGVITPNTTFLLGPDLRDGSFKPCAVKSIHYKRLPVGRVAAGQTAALALKKVKRAAVRKGMALVDERLRPSASWEFDADVAVLTHSTTIQPRYQAVIHCEIVRQSARVIAMDTERLRSGDRACVRFRFLQRPEYLTPGTRFVFRGMFFCLFSSFLCSSMSGFVACVCVHFIIIIIIIY